MDQLPMEWFFDVPVVTRVWTCAIGLSALLEQCDVVSKPQLMYSYSKVFQQKEYWRLVTTFLYFGPLSINLLFNAFFVSRFSRMLEESFYHNHTREYTWILFVGACSLITIASVFGGGGNGLPFLGPYLSNCLIYIWARRNPGVELSFWGLFNFNAPYLPWVLALSSIFLNGPQKLKGQLMGTMVGHVIFYFEDIYPRISDGKRLLAPPWTWFENQQGQQQEQLVQLVEEEEHNHGQDNQDQDPRELEQHGESTEQRPQYLSRLMDSRDDSLEQRNMSYRQEREQERGRDREPDLDHNVNL